MTAVVKDSAPKATDQAVPRYQIYGKKSADGSVNALLLNRGTTTIDIVLDFADIWEAHGGLLLLRDLWAEKDLGTFSRQYKAKNIPAHGNVALSLRQP